MKGLRTAIYYVTDLTASRDWYAEAFEKQPYFDEPFYVGFEVGGYELGLLPASEKHRPGPGGTVVYWGVDDAGEAVERLLSLGAQRHEDVEDVGGDVRVAAVVTPEGNILGIIENPHFKGGA